MQILVSKFMANFTCSERNIKSLKEMMVDRHEKKSRLVPVIDPRFMVDRALG